MPCLLVNLRKIKQQQTAGGLIHQTFVTKRSCFWTTKNFKIMTRFNALTKQT